MEELVEAQERVPCRPEAFLQLQARAGQAPAGFPQDLQVRISGRVGSRRVELPPSLQREGGGEGESDGGFGPIFPADWFSEVLQLPIGHQGIGAAAAEEPLLLISRSNSIGQTINQNNFSWVMVIWY